jgi:hypothetical protein
VVDPCGRDVRLTKPLLHLRDVVGVMLARVGCAGRAQAVRAEAVDRDLRLRRVVEHAFIDAISRDRRAPGGALDGASAAPIAGGWVRLQGAASAPR